MSYSVIATAKVTGKRYGVGLMSQPGSYYLNRLPSRAHMEFKNRADAVKVKIHLDGDSTVFLPEEGKRVPVSLFKFTIEPTR